MIRRELALAGVAEFDLHGRMSDRKPMAKLLRNLDAKGIPRIAVAHDEMTGQRDFRGAHRPDVEIVHLAHTGERFEIGAHLRRIDPGRNGCH